MSEFRVNQPAKWYQDVIGRPFTGSGYDAIIMAVNLEGTVKLRLYNHPIFLYKNVQPEQIREMTEVEENRLEERLHRLNLEHSFTSKFNNEKSPHL